MTAARMIGLVCVLVCGTRGSSATPPPDEAATRLTEATLERRVFRHIFVGKVQYPSERLTWVLSRGATSAQLEVFCQEGQKQPSIGIRLDGAETSDSYWLPPAAVRYVGKKIGDNPLHYELSIAAAAQKGSWCSSAPSTLVMDCKPVKISVVEAGAVLIPGKKRDDDTMTRAHWNPATRRGVAGLRCQLAPGDDVAAWRAAASAKVAAPVFVPAAPGAPGVEWADENSDMIVQEGAYRQMLAVP